MTDHSTGHRHVRADGIQLFLREAAPRDAPVASLRHAYPCASLPFRPHSPTGGARSPSTGRASGYSDTPGPARVAYDDDAYADILSKTAVTPNCTS